MELIPSGERTALRTSWRRSSAACGWQLHALSWSPRLWPWTCPVSPQKYISRCLALSPCVSPTASASLPAPRWMDACSGVSAVTKFWSQSTSLLLETSWGTGNCWRWLHKLQRVWESRSCKNGQFTGWKYSIMWWHFRIQEAPRSSSFIGSQLAGGSSVGICGGGLYMVFGFGTQGLFLSSQFSKKLQTSEFWFWQPFLA